MKGKNSHKSIRALTRAVDLVGQGWSHLIIHEADLRIEKSHRLPARLSHPNGHSCSALGM